VAAFVEALENRDRQLEGKRLLAVGPATAAELASCGLRVDHAPATFGGMRALARGMPAGLAGSYMYPCSDAAPLEERKSFLEPLGIRLWPARFYTLGPAAEQPLPDEPFPRVLFTSPSTVQAYFARYPMERQRDRTWVAIGPSTRKSLRSLGLPVEDLEG
jgi:uroporphyrinogen-III synthase